MSYVTHYAGARSQRWTTPQEFFDRLNARFEFTLDGAADPQTTKLPRFHGPNEIFATWRGERVFCNPPWSNIEPFMDLAAEG